MVVVNVDKNINDNILIVGCGEGGNRISQEFYNQGFQNTIAINSAKVDLDGLTDLPEDRKFLVNVTGGLGAGKDPELIKKNIDKYYDEVSNFIKSKINGQDMALITCGGGGGTGTGLSLFLAEIVSNLGLNVGMIFTLPIKNESTLVFVNALQNLNEIYENVKTAAISPFIIVDNNELYNRYNSSVVNFWSPINSAIVKVVKSFNEYSKQTSKYISALDRQDLKKVLSCGGSCGIGSIDISNVDNEETIMDKIGKSFFMSGFDLSSFKSAGVIVTGTEETLATPESAKFLNTIFDKISKIGGGMFFRGVYAEKDVRFLRLYVIFNGLLLPEERVNEMIREVNVGYQKIKSQENRVDGVFFNVDKRVSGVFSQGGPTEQKKIIRQGSILENTPPATVRNPIVIPGTGRRER